MYPSLADDHDHARNSHDADKVENAAASTSAAAADMDDREVAVDACEPASDSAATELFQFDIATDKIGEIHKAYTSLPF
ncbi:hypothetical protein CIG75_06540 [Tumebacillus algifaecis]|uniref:Uncharacterized protein n=1 Tax=Tumebacillus algifaecis TaxID=1214604 RepID=A0A223CZ97_9BACL|nr:hypothetical protein CIG75_06540 [Tumebacillus algifaecis]